jgi:putative exporter of polyketide antibiotics
MTGPLVLVAIAVVALFIVSELIVAVLPVVIIVAMVPPEERKGLAEVLAAADSRRRLRLWRALRVAASARRAALGRQAR